MSPEEVEILQGSRRRERAQAAFYRHLTGAAEEAGDAAAAERLNELLADEQHHVSRVTARLLEEGVEPDRSMEAPEFPALDAWETAAAVREADEVRWYEDALERTEDPDARAVLSEILASERHHQESLGGKWMSAAPHDHEDEGAA